VPSGSASPPIRVVASGANAALRHMPATPRKASSLARYICGCLGDPGVRHDHENRLAARYQFPRPGAGSRQSGTYGERGVLEVLSPPLSVANPANPCDRSLTANP
jgi:hypothetical protein